jgi:hypothetical protein
MDAAGGALEDLDGFENVLFALFAEAGDVAEFTLFGDAFDIVDAAGLKMAEEEGDFFGAEGLEIEEFENALGIFFEEFLAEAVVAGFNDFSEMFDHAFANAWKFFEFIGRFDHLGDGIGKAFDEFGGFFVSAITADDGAIDFAELSSLAEDASNLSVIHGRIISLGRWRFPLKRKRELNAETQRAQRKDKEN